MPSPLFQNAQRAFKREALRQFRKSEFGQLIGEMDRARRSSRPSTAKIRRLQRKLSRVRDTGLADALKKTETGREISAISSQISRYARSSAGDVVMDYLFSALGPLGGVLKGLLRPSGKSTASSVTKELAAAKDLLEAFGYTVEAPGGGPPKQGGTREQRAQEMAEAVGGQLMPSQEAMPRQRPGPSQAPTPSQAGPAQTAPRQNVPTRIDPDFRPRRDEKIELRIGGQRLRVREDDPLLTGEMLNVESSNVHSIGFNYNMAEPTKGTLKVRFLQKSRKGGDKTAGPLYYYHGVNPLVFEAFQRARSKGEFVWDRLRIRGTVSGHQYHYELAGISEGYVPRKATRLGPNEYFIGRQVKTRGGQTLESQLQDQFRGRARPQRPSMGIPNRGAPNRGRPNRGR